MKRNRGGERDLDHIILAADPRASTAPGSSTRRCARGLILMMDRTFDAAAERGHRREGDPLRARAEWSASTSRGRARAARGTTTRSSRRWSRRPAPPASASRSTSARRAAGARGDRRGRRVAAARPDRPRHPRGGRPGADGGAARGRDRARDLPDVEPAHEGAGGRGRGARHLPHVRRERRPASRSPPTARR